MQITTLKTRDKYGSKSFTYGLEWLDCYGASREGAKEYYDSIFELYALLGVDFVKCDDIARELALMMRLRQA